MRYLFIIIIMVLLTITPAQAQDKYIKFDADQVIKFELTGPINLIDVYVDLDNDGRADYIFVTPIIIDYPIKVGEFSDCNEECQAFLESKNLLELRTEEEIPYKYIISKDYIFYREVGKTDLEEFTKSREAYTSAIETRTGGKNIIHASDYVIDPELLDPDGTIDWNDPLFADQYKMFD